jgi:P-type E1-E2 ATPase
MVLVTGDRREEAERVGALLGLDEVVSEVLPEDKLSVVEGEQARGGRVLMVGDGVNDALALSRADVGVALGARVNDIVLGGADVALLTGDPHRIPELLELAGRARRTVWQNLALALGLVAFMVAAAARGSVSPLIGALVHDLGAVLVVANAARMLRRDGSEAPPSPVEGDGEASGPAATEGEPTRVEG